MNDVRSSTDKLDLYQCADRELWYAQGEDWALPMFVIFHQDKASARQYAYIEPCFSLYTSQLLLVTKLFEAHDLLGRENPWLIPKQSCEALLTKAPGITPERYYKWPDCKLRPLPAWKPVSYGVDNLNGVGKLVPAEDSRAFIQFVSESSGVQSSIVRIVMDAVADAAPKWMMEERKAVDLGFCRLIAAPFRGNWKEIIIAKLGAGKLLKLFSNHRGKELTGKLHEIGLPETMTSPHNIGFRSKQIDYVLEVVPTSKFAKYAKAFSDDLIRRGRTSYVQHYEQMVESIYNELVSALRYYIKKVSTPFAKVSDSGYAGILRILPARRQQGISNRLPFKALPQRIIPTDSHFSVFAEQDRIRVVQKEAVALPEVSDIPSPATNLWQSTLAANTECFPERDDAPGAIRVSMCDVDQKLTAWESMLPGSETGAGNPSGLDGKGNK